MGNRATAIANLKKKGAEANPNGRPKKGYSITEWFQEMLKSNPETRDAIGASIAAKALEGDPAAIKLIWNYMDGMPKQGIDLTSGGKPIPLLTGIADDVPTDNGPEETTKAK